MYITPIAYIEWAAVDLWINMGLQMTSKFTSTGHKKQFNCESGAIETLR